MIPFVYITLLFVNIKLPSTTIQGQAKNSWFIVHVTYSKPTHSVISLRQQKLNLFCLKLATNYLYSENKQTNCCQRKTLFFLFSTWELDYTTPSTYETRNCIYLFWKTEHVKYENLGKSLNPNIKTRTGTKTKLCASHYHRGITRALQAVSNTHLLQP